MRRILAAALVPLLVSCTTHRARIISPSDSIAANPAVRVHAEGDFEPAGFTVHLTIANGSDAAVDLDAATATIVGADGAKHDATTVIGKPIAPRTTGHATLLFALKDLPDGSAEVTITPREGEPWSMVMEIERVSGAAQSERVRNGVVLGIAGALVLAAYVTLEYCGRPENDCF